MHACVILGGSPCEDVFIGGSSILVKRMSPGGKLEKCTIWEVNYGVMTE